jgi:hypothetical protein
VVKQPEVVTYEVSEPVFTITGDSEPHLYQIQIKWPKNLNPIQILVDGVILARVLPTESNSFTFKAQDRRIYVVAIKAENQDKVSILDSRKIEVPTDYIFSSTEVLTKDSVTKANRIYFKKTAVIETSKFNFTIEADEIFFEDGAHIINFTTPPRVESQKDGVSGGNVTVLARIAHGQIQIDLSGGDGANGIQGFPWWIPHDDGKNGVAGTCSQAGMAPPMCQVQPIDGANSPDGNRGKTGFQGHKGGNSGSLIVEIADQSEVEITHSEHVGIGGEGGEGGIGQMKGRPGKAAPRDESCLCPQGKDGEDTGRNGDQGLQGPRGLDGNIGTICISVGKGPNQCTGPN